MKIVGSILISLGAAAAALVVTLSGAVVGCSSTNNYNAGGGTSAVGESCTRTFDCKAGLACISGTCFPNATSDAGEGDAGEGGIPSGPHLGLLRESCQTSSDCQAPLECINNACSIISYNLTATGKSCTGECNSAADCCELPPNTGAYLEYWYSYSADGGALTGIHDGPGYMSSVRCEDLVSFFGGDTTPCSQTQFPAANNYLATACALYQTFCQCAPNTWTCSPTNQCLFTGPCASPVVGETSQTCPSGTRTGRSVGTCNIPANATTGTCQAGCSMDSDCVDKTPTSSGHTCSGVDGGPTNCTCYQSSCYFKCNSDLDCQGGYSCDTMGTHLCKQAACTSNADCVLEKNDPRAQCVTGACQIPCQADIECGTSTSTICSGGFCKPSGCTSDTDCTGTVHEFCVTAPPASALVGAITN
jgi:hypothetical protein